MEGLTTIQKIAVLAVPVLLAITVHEAAHGWVAKRLGDSTADKLGRVTLNPLKHIDPIGTIIVPLILFLFSSFLFGWAKPVPVNWRNLNRPRRDMALVAVAGPMANLVMVLIWAIILRIGISLDSEYAWFAQPMFYMGSAGILINSILMILNLLPILPLDGGRIVSSLLPAGLSATYAKLEPWGLVIIIALLATNLLGSIVGPGVELVNKLGLALVGLG